MYRPNSSGPYIEWHWYRFNLRSLHSRGNSNGTIFVPSVTTVVVCVISVAIFESDARNLSVGLRRRCSLVNTWWHAVQCRLSLGRTALLQFCSCPTLEREVELWVLFYLRTLSQMQNLWCVEWHVDCDGRLSWRAFMYCSEGSIAGPWSLCDTSRIDDGEQPAPWLCAVDILERKFLYLHVERSGPFWKRSQSTVSITCVQGVRAVED